MRWQPDTSPSPDAVMLSNAQLSPLTVHSASIVASRDGPLASCGSREARRFAQPLATADEDATVRQRKEGRVILPGA